MNNQKISEREERLKKLNELQKLGINPYPAKSCRSHAIKDVLNEFSQLEKSQKAITAVGRLRSSRGHGNLTFAHLEDASGRIQIAISKKEIRLAATNGDHANENKDGIDLYKIFTKLVDTGDFIEIMGKCFLTHKGEQSVMVKQWKILAKALRPLPDKWHGLK
ncbi:OB-fold nucleic acid binding domain-containing protein, partial [Candidatus Parcubacteria bacterium]|nr:OB-fold nucleic acid binding domain-containing protein [Candidatus Parcubacteria bacterium]